MSRYCLQHRSSTNCLTLHLIHLRLISKTKTEVSENLCVLGCCGIKFVSLFNRENDVLRAEHQYLRNIISSMVCLDHFLHSTLFCCLLFLNHHLIYVFSCLCKRAPIVWCVIMQFSPMVFVQVILRYMLYCEH